jgi:hypothetical protein
MGEPMNHEFRVQWWTEESPQARSRIYSRRADAEKFQAKLWRRPSTGQTKLTRRTVGQWEGMKPQVPQEARPVHCEDCGEPLGPRRSTARFCGDRCRLRSWRRDGNRV